jgi:predicted MPP superfamily phosphohydrolase
MKNFKILWIDDDWNNKDSNEYKILEKIYQGIIKNRKVIIERFSTIDGGVHQLTIEAFDFVIIDLDFQNEDKTSRHMRSASNIINTIKKHQIKFAILTNHSKAGRFLPKKEIEEVKHLLVDIYQKSEKSREQLISDIVDITSFSPINIMQLSDFHFNSKLVKNEKDEQQKRFDKLIELVNRMNQTLPIDYIVFSGDLASNYPTDDIKESAIQIRNLVNNTIKDYSKFLIVPGNHDIEWEDFDNAKIGSSPGKAFYHFLCDIYAGNKEVISKLVGFNPKNNSFDYNHPDSFSWSYSNDNGLVKFLCLNSVIAESDYSLRGKGKISPNTISFIKQEWDVPPQKNELRIAVFHHNILPPFSINKLDENSNLLNTGETIEILTKHGCDIILGGHCHDSYLYKLSYSTLNYRGYDKTKNITYISTSTSGGYSPTKDRPRSFNIIRIYQAKQKGIKSIQIIPFAYDSKENEWIELNGINDLIKQNG